MLIFVHWNKTETNIINSNQVDKWKEIMCGQSYQYSLLHEKNKRSETTYYTDCQKLNQQPKMNGNTVLYLSLHYFCK